MKKLIKYESSIPLADNDVYCKKMFMPYFAKQYIIGNTIYTVNSFFDKNSKSSVNDIVERLAVREINKNIA